MSPPTSHAKLFCQTESLLGEGPFWWEGRLYWVDILQSRLHHCGATGQDLQTIVFPSHVGAVVPWEDGFMAGTAQGLGFMSTDGRFELLPQSPALPEGIRFNDGKLDPAGRFWCGTMEYAAAAHAGSLYRVERDGSIALVLDELTIANGLAWNASATLFYYIDTSLQRVDVFDYDIQSGAIENRRVAFEVPEVYGLPDGMCMDEQGRLWIAFWRGSQVVAFEPETGTPTASVRVPTRLTSSCNIGADGRKLFITTARTELSPDQLVEEPLAGSVFCVDLATV